MSVEHLESQIESGAVKQGTNWIWMKCNFTHFPDRVCFGSGGKVVFIEFKTKTGPTRPGQKLIQDKLKAFGFPVYTCRSKEEALAVLAKEFKVHVR